MRLAPFDLLLIGILVYFLVRMVLRGRNGNRPGNPPRRQDPRAPTSSPEQPEDPRRQAADAYQRAQVAWDMLRSKDAQRTPAPAADGFDTSEFLDGARAMCARIRQSWDARDLEDLRQFATDNAMAEFERRAATETRSARSEPLLIEAELVERTTRDDGLEEATVLYRILEKIPGTGDNRDTREMWRYTRNPSDTTDTWRLDHAQPVDDASNLPQ